MVHVQPKLNGIRALYQNGNFQSRDELPWNPGVLEHLSKILRLVIPPRYILDGELYRHRLSLQRINSAVAINRTQPSLETATIEYYIFDRISYQLPFAERFVDVQVHQEILKNTAIKIVNTVRVETEAEADVWYSRFVTLGFEGMMYRMGDCRYTQPSEGRKISDKNNRVWHLLKRKAWETEEFECVRVIEGLGKRSEMVGAFECYVKGNSGSTFNVGSGLTEEEATYYFHQPPIGRKILVKFLTYTEDGKPFNPTIEAIPCSN